MHKHAFHLLSVSQLDPASLVRLLAEARELRSLANFPPVLEGATVVLIFEKPSLRTRVTFEVAIRGLGGWPVLLGASESRLGEREPVSDLARNLSLWVNAIVARVFSHEKLEELALHSDVPVINALSDLEHPCQALADMLTLQDVWGTFQGRRLVYVGDWNNVSRSLWHAARGVGMEFGAVCPAGYGPQDWESVDWSTDLCDVRGADAIYTDTWVSMGQEDESARRLHDFETYQVNDDLMRMTGKPSWFMHCLPAHRGQEVTDSVIDSHRSLVLQQAANRLPVEKAVLISSMEKHHEAADQEGRSGLFRGVGHLHHHSLAQGKLWM